MRRDALWLGSTGLDTRYEFRFVVERLRRGEDPRSALACTVGTKGYHAQTFATVRIRSSATDPSRSNAHEAGGDRAGLPV